MKFFSVDATVNHIVISVKVKVNLVYFTLLLYIFFIFSNFKTGEGAITKRDIS